MQRSITRNTSARSDEWFTRAEDVERVLPFVREHMRGQSKPILCPFDSEESEFVRVLKREGFDVVFGDLTHDGKDFFEDWDFDEYALVISNPPFSLSNKALRVLLNAGVPFALLTRYDGAICARANYEAFERNKNTLSLLLVDGRLKFVNDGVARSVPYYVSWICNKFTEEQCVFLDCF